MEQLAQSAAEVRRLTANLAEVKQAYESKVEDFAKETLRASRQHDLLEEMARRLLDRGCAAYPWPKQCPDCEWLAKLAAFRQDYRTVGDAAE